MEGDGLLHPRGPLPPAVYWRRRLVVLGVALLAVVFLATQCAPGADDGGDDTNQAASTASATPSAKAKASAKPSASPSARPAATRSAAAKPVATTTSPAAAAKPSKAPAATPQCKPPALQVSVTTDARTYAAAGNPVVTMTIKNAGKTPCVRDIGPRATGLTISSGPDRIWSSDDCTPGGAGKNTVFKAGESKTITVTWNRKRSKPGAACVGAAAQPGQYKVVGRLGDLSTVPDSFGLTG